MSIVPEPDATQADWITSSTTSWQRLAVAGPDGFAAYARLVHDDEAGAPADDEHRAGSMTADQLERLVVVLARHTTSPERCLFGLSTILGVAEPLQRRRRLPRPRRRRSEQDEHPGAATIDIAQRGYRLFRGPVLDVPAWSRTAANHPHLMWPADRAWCTATDVDVPWTGIGGTEALVEDLMRADLGVHRETSAERDEDS